LPQGRCGDVQCDVPLGGQREFPLVIERAATKRYQTITSSSFDLPSGNYKISIAVFWHTSLAVS
jgi:hypothetical protein